MKKILVLVLSLVLVIGASGCVGDTPEPTDNGGESPLQTKVADLETNLANLQTKVNNLPNVSGLESDVSALQSQLNSLETKVDNLPSSTGITQAQLNSAVASLETQIAELEAQIGQETTEELSVGLTSGTSGLLFDFNAPEETKVLLTLDFTLTAPMIVEAANITEALNIVYADDNLIQFPTIPVVTSYDIIPFEGQYRVLSATYYFPSVTLEAGESQKSAVYSGSLGSGYWSISNIAEIAPESSGGGWS